VLLVRVEEYDDRSYELDGDDSRQRAREPFEDSATCKEMKHACASAGSRDKDGSLMRGLDRIPAATDVLTPRTGYQLEAPGTNRPG
jgi:hypothetical protein